VGHLPDIAWVALGMVGSLAGLAILASIAAEMRHAAAVEALRARVESIRRQRAEEARLMKAADEEIEVIVVGEGEPLPADPAGAQPVRRAA
jgi:capsule polysaccharide export protein KpsE/RkpR